MTLVHTDKRRRASLTKVLEPETDYRVSVSAHGTVTLEPVETVSRYELRLAALPGVMDQIARDVAEVEEGILSEPRVQRERSRVSA